MPGIGYTVGFVDILIFASNELVNVLQLRQLALGKGCGQGRLLPYGIALHGHEVKGCQAQQTDGEDEQGDGYLKEGNAPLIYY
jgi:hypothetical protein